MMQRRRRLGVPTDRPRDQREDEETGSDAVGQGAEHGAAAIAQPRRPDGEGDDAQQPERQAEQERELADDDLHDRRRGEDDRTRAWRRSEEVRTRRSNAHAAAAALQRPRPRVPKACAASAGKTTL